MNATAYSATGTKSAQKTTLPKGVFDLKVDNHQLLKTAYEAYLANGRANLAVTKTRGLVRGGGRKPWRQKGTGRARFGSSRNPIWRGGGISFGPTGQENYRISLSLKARRLALRQALSLAASDDKVIIIEDIKLKNPKTGELAKLLNKLGAKSRCLIVAEVLSDNLKLAAANINYLTLSRASSLNVFDTLNANQLIVTKGALAAIDMRLGDKS